MIKGLSQLVLRISGRQDIGPVPISINLHSHVGDQEMEQLREYLLKIGITPENYYNLAEGKFKVLAGFAPRRVYEEVFHVKVKTHRPFNDRKYSLEYRDLTTPIVPEDLRKIVSSVNVANGVYAAEK